MGILDKLMGKDAPALEPLTVYAPVTGTALPLERIPDPVFSQGVLGPGCGIEPEKGAIYAPFHGKITQLADTRHAIGITSTDGLEVLIHVGIDTVDMDGRGFSAKVSEGKSVKKGDLLLEFSLAEIRAAGHPATTVVLVTNADEVGTPVLSAQGNIENGMPLLRITKNG